ncbi:MAG: hypothetical protein M3N42_18675 [Cyanobacteriota bacterium]|nr:hypothetical protein [Cyanobacteriota bacterium]
MLQQQAGYEVLYQKFNGSHTVPEAIVSKAGRLVYAIISNRDLNTLVTPSKFFKG